MFIKINNIKAVYCVISFIKKDIKLNKRATHNLVGLARLNIKFLMGVT